VLDPRQLFTVTEETADIGQPVMIEALTGFVDAGNATRLAREHLLATLESRPIIRFDLDQLMDYRSRRPLMQFDGDHWESYDEPAITVHLLRDRQDTPFLLLEGAEPDLQWERFIAAVSMIVKDLRVRLSVGLTAIPMGVPHTRPAGVTAHATTPDLITGYEPWLQRVQVPASAANLLEYRLGQQGQPAMGFAVHVPHYLAQAEYPQAAETLLTSISKATGLLLPTEELRRSAEAIREDIDRQVAANPEAAELVAGLEQQYDSFVRGRTSTNLLAEAGPLPTAEELGAELERFLAEHGPGTPEN
jgi:proteasome assembly chaperone (PAC2) family protein